MHELHVIHNGPRHVFWKTDHMFGVIKFEEGYTMLSCIQIRKVASHYRYRFEVNVKEVIILGRGLG